MPVPALRPGAGGRAETPERGALDQTSAAGQGACCPSTEARCNPKSKTALRVTLLGTGQPERHTQEVEAFPCGVVRVSPKSIGGFHELGVMVLEGDDPWCRRR
jgi:hypothetical protein